MSSAELIEAVKTGDVARVRAILAEDPGAAAARPEGQPSAILMAAYTGNADLLAILTEHTELDAVEAAVVGRVNRLDELLARDPRVVTARSGDGRTPLHAAGFFGKVDAVERLLDAHAEVMAISSNYMANTPLHAAIAGRTDHATVRLLVQRGADVNHRAAGGWTPLHLAASRGSLPVIELLLEAGADPAATSDDGKTAADVARERGHPDAARRLEPSAA
jgi:ankyrin repeat protein